MDVPDAEGVFLKHSGRCSNVPIAKQAVKTKPKQDKPFSFVCFHRFLLSICCLSVVLWLDKGDAYK